MLDDPRNPSIPEMSVEESFAQLDSLRAGAQRYILGLAGAPGSGKSTLAERLHARAPDRSAIVPMDGFHLANAELRRLGIGDRKGAEDTFDIAGYVALLRRLRVQPAAEVIYAPKFHREIEEAIAGEIPILYEQQLIITEGNYLLLDRGHWSDIEALVDEIWYVDVPDELRVRRLVARHVRFGRSEAAATEWVERTDEVNSALVASTRIRADRIVRLQDAPNAR